MVTCHAVPGQQLSILFRKANAGVRLCKNLWLDAGFFRTHVGTEGLFPKENITSSVAVATYFEPYYEAGLKLSYAATEKLALSLYVLNGYNLYEDNNKKEITWSACHVRIQ